MLQIKKKIAPQNLLHLISLMVFSEEGGDYVVGEHYSGGGEGETVGAHAQAAGVEMLSDKFPITPIRLAIKN